jgi:proline iminopeptidase
MFHRSTLLLCAIAVALSLPHSCDAQDMSADNRPSATGEHNVVLNGIRLYYRVAGKPISDRIPTIFLHGGPGYNSYSFATLAGTRLEPHLAMVYLDQRGCGRSERPWTQAYSMYLLMQDIEALRLRLGVAKISLIGHSFGGTLALEYAARHPEHVSRIVFVDGMADGPASIRMWRDRLEAWDPTALRRVSSAEKPQPDTAENSECAETKALMSLVNQATGKNGKAFFDHLQFVDQSVRERQDAVDAESGLKNTGELSNALFSTGLACYRFTQHARLTMPVLVIGGRQDGAIGIETMRDLASKLPHAKFIEYEKSAHFPYLEEPERFTADVTAFLTGTRPQK